MATVVKNQEREDVRHRFEWDAENFGGIYKLERSRLSRWFNLVFRKAIFERFEIAFRRAGDVKGTSVLDIGCGSGVYAVEFAQHGAKRVLGVDFSTNMLRLAREEAQNERVTDICEFREGDFLTIPLEEKFDVTIAMGVFDYLSEPLPFLKKMGSVTTGRVIASFPGHSVVRENTRKLRYKLTRRGSVHFYSREDVEELAKRAGFASFEIDRIPSSGGGYVLIGQVGGP